MHNLARILFVEDHPDIRETMALLLEDHGYEVTSVGSAEEGLARLEAGSAFDLIVSDHTLPGQSGAWLLQQAISRGLIEPTRALIVTALSDPPDCEGLTVLNKPLDVNRLLEMVAGRLPGEPTD